MTSDASYLLSGSQPLVPFEEHWRETVFIRKATRDSSAVAEALQTYQDERNWPRTGFCLPDRLREAAQKRKFWFQTESLWPFYFLLFVFFAGDALAAIYGIYYCVFADITIRTEQVLVVALLVCCISVALLSTYQYMLDRTTLVTHVKALHLLYVYERMPMMFDEEEPEREEVFSMAVRQHGSSRPGPSFTVFTDGTLEAELAFR